MVKNNISNNSNNGNSQINKVLLGTGAVVSVASVAFVSNLMNVNADSLTPADQASSNLQQTTQQGVNNVAPTLPASNTSATQDVPTNNDNVKIQANNLQKIGGNTNEFVQLPVDNQTKPDNVTVPNQQAATNQDSAKDTATKTQQASTNNNPDNIKVPNQQATNNQDDKGSSSANTNQTAKQYNNFTVANRTANNDALNLAVSTDNLNPVLNDQNQPQPQFDDLKNSVTTAENDDLPVNVTNNTIIVAPGDLDAAKAKVAADYQNQITDINNKVTSYDADKKAYDAAVAKLTADGSVDPNSITQGFTLGKEPQATISISDVQGGKLTGPMAYTVPPLEGYQVPGGTDSSTYYSYVSNDKTGTPGQVLTATYDNIKNSTYVDGNGTLHHISKIVETFSDLQGSPNKSWNDNPTLWVMNDPSDGLWYYYSDGVSVTYTYYDDQGQPIEFNGKNSILSMGSNNAWYSASDTDPTEVLNGVPKHVEGFTADNGQGKKIIGSSVSVHNGKDMYSNYTNSNSEVNPKIPKDWDTVGAPNSYYGAGLDLISGTAPKVTYHVQRNSTDTNGSVWAWSSTSLPASPLKEPVKPDLTANFTNIETFATDIPTKTVTNDSNQDIDNKNVSRGDNLNYHLTWDLSGWQGVSTDQMDPATVAKGMSFSDTYTGDKVAPQKDNLKLLDASGQDITDQVNINWDDANSTWTMTAKDPNTFLKNYGGQKLTINFPTTILKDATGDIPNKGSQDDFGNKVDTNTVIDHVPNSIPSKGVTDGSGKDVNNQNVPLNSTVDYQLGSSVRPADYGGTTTQWSIKDALSPKDQPTGKWEVTNSQPIVMTDGSTVAPGTDISKYFTYNYDPASNTVTVTANKDLLDILNSDANKKTAQAWNASVEVKRIGTGTIDNVADEDYNNQDVDTNKVTTVTPPPTDIPTKTVTNDSNQDIDNKNVSRGDNLNYHLTWDLSGYDPADKIDPDTIAKGMSFSDTYTGDKVAPQKDSLKLVDANGKDITDQVNINWDDANNTWTMTAKDPQAFYNNYAGQKLTINFPTTILKDATGDIPNKGSQDDFGNKVDTNTVVDHIPDQHPTKGITDDSGKDVNNQDVPLNSTVDYQLGSSVRPENYGGTTTQWSIIDKLDPKDQPTGKWSVSAIQPIVMSDGSTIAPGTDISKYFTYNYDKDTNTVTVTANKDLLDILNSDANKKTAQAWNASVQVKRIGTGTINNVANEGYNNQGIDTNKVTTNTPEPTPAPNPKPSKTVTNTAGQDINDSNVSRGDALDYHLTWDLSGWDNNNMPGLTSDDYAKGLSFSDTYDGSKIAPQKDNLKLVDDANGKDITDQVNVNWDDANNTWTMTAKDPKAFLKDYAGQKLTINFPTTVLKDVTGDIPNKGNQDDFGNKVDTNTVVDHVPNSNPTKDVINDSGVSINNQDVPLNSTIDYKLGSSVRPENYGGTTTQWSIIDKLDPKDQPTGKFTVTNSQPIVMSDGSTIAPGTDISNYFTYNYDKDTNTVTVSANKDLLDILNSDANKKTAQAWNANIQVKRIGTGNIKNTATENYNGQDVNTNTVDTNTPEPTPQPTPQPQPNPTPTPEPTPQPKGNEVTHYVDQDGNPLAPQDNQSGDVGNDYNTKPKDIPGYHIITIPANANGKYTDGTTSVTYVYAKDTPAPQPEPQPEPQPAPQPEPQPAPQPEPQPAPQPEPQPAPQPEPQPAPQPEPQPAPQPEPQPAPQPEPQPALQQPQPNLATPAVYANPQLPQTGMQDSKVLSYAGLALLAGAISLGAFNVKGKRDKEK